MSIPVVIGATGHRDIPQEAMPALHALVHKELSSLKAQYPHSPFVMLSALAAGADQLCAQEALALGFELVGPRPLPGGAYRKAVSQAGRPVFRALLGKAARVFVAPDTEPAPACADRDFHYRQAGIYVAAYSHVLLALWDGEPAKPNGCGTAEAVSFMLSADYRGSELKAVNDGAVLHIQTPRKSSAVPVAIASRLIEKQPGSLQEMLRMTDTFNAEPASASKPAYSLLPNEHINDSTRPLHDLYLQADAAALYHQKRYLRTIKWFSVFGMLLVLFFLFYDEIEADFFLLLYGAMMAIYALTYFCVRRGNAHEKYLQYRTLSEALRVQFFLLSAGVTSNIGNAFTWTQKQEATWVKEALSALLIGASSHSTVPDEVITAHWIDGQLAYHRGAMKRDGHKHHTKKGIAAAMLTLSVVLFLGVMLMELRFPSVMSETLIDIMRPPFLLPHDGWAFTLRSLLKIILGAASACTVFLSNYYDKLSLDRKCADHEKMMHLYAEAKAQLERGQMDRNNLLYHLAREEIIENGDWFSYCKENTPTFNL